MHNFVHRYQVNDVLKESDEKVREDTDTVHVAEGEHCGELDRCEVRRARAEEVHHMLGLEIFRFISEDAIWEKTSDKPITTKWVDVKKRSYGGGMVVRSWSAARGFHTNNFSQRRRLWRRRSICSA